MEPLHPRIRQALKEAHPGLTDADIDAHEALVTERFSIDPDLEPERLAQIDRQHERLLREKMPRYDAVVASLRATPKHERTAPQVRLKRPPERKEQ